MGGGWVWEEGQLLGGGWWVVCWGLLGVAGGGGCFASAFCMCLSLVGLSYRGDSCIRLVDLADLLLD